MRTITRLLALAALVALVMAGCAGEHHLAWVAFWGFWLVLLVDVMAREPFPPHYRLSRCSVCGELENSPIHKGG